MSVLRFLTTCLLAAAALAPASNAADATSTASLVELKGRVLPLPNTTNLHFKVQSGPTYKLLPARDATALFADTNLHSKILLVKGHLRQNDSLEVIGNLHEIHDGKLYELYYYCDICSIETSFPGLCLCCREDVVLHAREKKR